MSANPISTDSIQLTERTYAVAIKAKDGVSNKKTVTGLVSPSGVFGIDRRLDIERKAKAVNDGLEETDELWVVTHIPTGMRIGWQISLSAATRNIDLLEPHADQFNIGSFGQVSDRFMNDETRSELCWIAMMAGHVTDMEFMS